MIKIKTKEFQRKHKNELMHYTRIKEIKPKYSSLREGKQL